MNKFKQMETFIAVASKGSLSAAAKAEGVAAAMIGRRIDALEARLGVKLMLRTTRRISLTMEGSAFLEDCVRIVGDIHQAEASVGEGALRATGNLRVTAPAGFGRRQVAPLVPRFHAQHPEVHVSLNLSDSIIDIADGGYDCAVRVGDVVDTSLVGVRLAENRRLCVATPAYLAKHGRPERPQDLAHFDCLTLSSDASQTRGWSFMQNGVVLNVKPNGPLDCSDGQVLHEWCLLGYGLAWRSTWEVEDDLASGRLVSVLDQFQAPPVASTRSTRATNIYRCACVYG